MKAGAIDLSSLQASDVPQHTSAVPKTSDVPDVSVGLSAFGNVTAMCSAAAASLGESGLPPSLTTQIKANRQLALERKAKANATKLANASIVLAEAMPSGVVDITEEEQADTKDDTKADTVTCAICKELLDKDAPDKIVTLPCAHTFHQVCIETWADKKGVNFNLCCPLNCAADHATFSVLMNDNAAMKEATAQSVAWAATQNDAPLEPVCVVPSALVALAEKEEADAGSMS